MRQNRIQLTPFRSYLYSCLFFLHYLNEESSIKTNTDHFLLSIFFSCYYNFFDDVSLDMFFQHFCMFLFWMVYYNMNNIQIRNSFEEMKNTLKCAAIIRMIYLHINSIVAMFLFCYSPLHLMHVPNKNEMIWVLHSAFQFSKRCILSIYSLVLATLVEKFCLCVWFN